MKKKGLFLVVALLALSGLMAAMAYSNAHVSNKTMAALVTTDKAWLAVVPNPDFADFARVNDKGVMVIDFAGAHGFQPGSNYEFNNLFSIKNNLTDKSIKVGLRFSSVYPHIAHNWIPGLRQISTSKDIEDYSTGKWLGEDGRRDLVFASSAAQFSSGWNEGRYVILGPGESIPLHWSFIVGDITSFGSNKWTLEIHSDTIGR